MLFAPIHNIVVMFMAAETNLEYDDLDDPYFQIDINNYFGSRQSSNPPEPPRRPGPQVIPHNDIMERQYQMCKDDKYTDLIARCPKRNSTSGETIDIPLHRLVALSNSQYFQAVITLQENATLLLSGENKSPNDGRQVVVVDTPAEIFFDIREYMYTSKCTIDRDRVSDLMCAAHLLGMTQLFNDTVDWFVRDPLHPEAAHMFNKFSDFIPEEIRMYIVDYLAWSECVRVVTVDYNFAGNEEDDDYPEGADPSYL